MAWSKGWWARIPSALDVGRASLAAIVGRTAGGRPLYDDGEGPVRDVEPTLRRLIAETLGVKPERIDLHASLVADLGIDPLDVLDLMTRIEGMLGVAFPEGEVEALRTFEDFVLVTRALVSVRTATERAAGTAVQARVRVGPPTNGTGTVLERVVMLTPYDCETLADDVAVSHAGEQREISLPANAPGDAFAMLDAVLLPSRLGGCRTIVRRLPAARDAHQVRELPMVDRTPATNAAALRIARHAVDLLEGLSDERGMTVLHLASNGRLFEPEVQAARAQTNRRIAAFRTIVRAYGRVLGLPLRTRLDTALERLGDLGAIRAIADELTTSDGDVLDAYHDVARALTRYVWTLEVGLPDPALVPQQMCLSALVAATEAGGIERAMIGCALARDVLTPSDRADATALIAQQRAQLDLAMSNASDDIATLLGRYARDPTFASVADYESRVLAARPDGPPGIDPTAWFRVMTTKLERLHDVEVQQLDRLLRSTQDYGLGRGDARLS
jgi:acyl carrier protein